jgi:ammonia channel protein AmtB
MYEPHGHELLSWASFAWRVIQHLAIALVLIGFGLGIGVAGYHFIGGLDWVDSILNASMILGGMGPVDPLKSPEAKLFASAYALFSGLFFIGIASLVVAPFAHRILHRFYHNNPPKR